MMQPVLASTGPDFSGDTVGLVVIKAVIVLIFLLVSVLFALWFERRIIGRFQARLAPHVRRPFGRLQSIPDALALLLKEHITVEGADRVIYTLAPLVAGVAALMIYAVIPFGPAVHVPGADIVPPLQLTDIPV